MMEHTFLLLAGDGRMRSLLHLLQEAGETAVHLSVCRSPAALQAHIAAADTVVLPIPVSKDGAYLQSAGEECILLSDVFEALQPGQRVFGGGFSAQQMREIASHGAAAVDFLRNDPFVLRNAALTAQGALRLILEHTNVPLPGLSVLITGYGKVGKATAALLNNIGCAVTIAARSETQRAEAMLCGCKTLPIGVLTEALPQTDVIVNTVPAPLFSAQTLQVCREGTLFLELASAPFGAAAEEVRANGLHHIPGGGLPGRFCASGCAAAMLPLLRTPVTHGEVIS